MIEPPSVISGAAARATAIERINAHIHRDAKAVARCINEIALEFLGRSIRD